MDAKDSMSHLELHNSKGILPSDRTTGTRPFQVIATDFTGPILYRTKNRDEKKAYILLFTCSLTRSIHLELLPDQAQMNSEEH